MNTTLKQLSSIQIGFQTRDKFFPEVSAPTEAIRIVQINDVRLEAEADDSSIEPGKMLPYLRTSDLSLIAVSGNIEKYSLKQNDVLFLSRGPRLFACAIVDQIPNSIASYYFYIVRPDTTRVLPEYLAWYINQQKFQACLAKFHQGSVMQMVPKAFFEEIEIENPSLRDQRAIIELEKLRQREDLITRQLIRARKKFINGLCMQYLQKNSIKENQKSGEYPNG